MRARKKKNCVQRLEKCSEWITDQVEVPEGKELRLEIGCGKGKFITELASRPENADIEFVALEIVPDVMVMAVEKASEKELKNLKFIATDARNLPEICPHHRVSVIYLNFSDPWPKKRQTKRRLTYRDFLEIYRTLLTEDGYIVFKTDNVPLFDFSVEEIPAHGYEMYDVTRDLHNSGIDNPATTEYEDKFTRLNFPICSLKARPIPGYVPPAPEKKPKPEEEPAEAEEKE